MPLPPWKPCGCEVNRHPREAEIESALWLGWGHLPVARYFALHGQVVKVHWEKHMRGKKPKMGKVGPPVAPGAEGAQTEADEEAALAALETLALRITEANPPPPKRGRGRPKGSKNKPGWRSPSKLLALIQSRNEKALAEVPKPKVKAKKPVMGEDRARHAKRGERPPDSVRDVMTEEDLNVELPEGLEKDPEFAPAAMQETVALTLDGKPIHSGNLAARCKASGDTWQHQVEFLSYLLDSGKFYFGHTLEWVRHIWGVNHAQIKARFESAVKRCSGYRQSVIANTIATISALENQEREAMAAWHRSNRQHTPNARFLQLAIQARSKVAYAAGIGHQNLKVDMNVWVRPEFVQAVDQLTEVALNTLAPAQDEQFKALVARVEEKLGTRADPGVVAAVLETAADLMNERLAILAREHSEDAGPSAEEAEEIPAPEEVRG